MKIKFRNIKMSKANLQKLSFINSIIEDYQEQGYTMTLRQLYYQLVSKDLIPNKVQEYAKLSGLLKEGRMSGIVDWDAIEDRLRVPSKPAAFDSPADIIKAAINQYQLPRMKGQKNYVEVWVEKDALSGVLKRVTQQYHVPIMVNRGYSSATAMFESYNRFKDAIKDNQVVNVLYLGDHDPSGLDMVRDITQRTLEFFAGSELCEDIWQYETDEAYKKDMRDAIEQQSGETDWEILDEVAKSIYIENVWFKKHVKVHAIALTTEQVRFYNPPPNPAKVNDPRAKDYISRFGHVSWEVDALPPKELDALLHREIKQLIDIGMYEGILEKEKLDIDKLKQLSTNL